MRGKQIGLRHSAGICACFCLLCPALIGYSQTDVSQLINKLKDPDAQARRTALEKLVYEPNHDPGEVEPLISALDDPDEKVRMIAISVLSQIKDVRAVAPLISILNGKNSDGPGCRDCAASALGHIKDPRAVVPLIATLGDANSGLRETSLLALGEIGDPRAVEPLVSVLNSTCSNFKEYETQAHRPRNWKALDADLCAQSRKDAAIALGAIKDSRAVEPLIAALSDRNYSVAWEATAALGDIGDPRAVRPLAALLEDPRPKFPVHVVVALSGLGAPAVEALIGALKSADIGVRQAATDGLGKIGDQRAIDPLIASLKDPAPSVRRSAAENLSSFKDPKAITSLLSLLEQEDTEVIAGAMEFFVQRGVQDSESLLIKALYQSGDVGTAEVLLNCGNLKLEEAAGAWARLHGYHTIPMPGLDSSIWGSAR